MHSLLMKSRSGASGKGMQGSDADNHTVPDLINSQLGLIYYNTIAR
jgi:hypothetical protein